MKSLFRFLTIISIVSLSSYAGDFQPINKGEASPISGFVLSVDIAQNLRKDVLELSNYKALAESYQRTITLKNLTVELQKEQIDILKDQTKDLKQTHTMNQLENAGWFFLGVLFTSASIYGAVKVIK